MVTNALNIAVELAPQPATAGVRRRGRGARQQPGGGGSLGRGVPGRLQPRRRLPRRRRGGRRGRLHELRPGRRAGQRADARASPGHRRAGRRHQDHAGSRWRRCARWPTSTCWSPTAGPTGPRSTRSAGGAATWSASDRARTERFLRVCCRSLDRVAQRRTILRRMPKVSIIGAGSVEFTRNVVTDLCSFPELHGSLELSLHDVDPDRLRYAESLVRRIDEQSGSGAVVSADLDRAAAVEGSDYVLNEIQVGGYAATRTDFDVPARYGVRQTISDTIGIGGIFRGAADHPGAAGHRRGPGPGRPGRLPAQLQQPDGDAALGGVRRHALPARRRAVPLGARHPPAAGRAGRRTAGRGGLHHRRLQPPGVRAALRAPGRRPLPAAARGGRGGPRAAAPGARRDLPPVRLLPDRVQRAQRGVRAVDHAPRRPGRAVPGRRSASTSPAPSATWRSTSPPARRSRPPTRST